MRNFRMNLSYLTNERSTNNLLAKCCGCTDRQVRRYRSGETRPKVDLIIKMARCLDVDAGHLCFMDNRMFRIYYNDKLLSTFVEVNNNFLRNAELLRSRKDLSLNDIARCMYRSDTRLLESRRRRVGRLLAGINTFFLDDVAQLSEVLDCEPSRLLFGEL